MNSEFARQVLQLFEQALAVSTEELDSFLNRSCGENTTLRKQVELLLSSHEEASGMFPYIDQQNTEQRSPLQSPDNPPSVSGFDSDTILAGRYQLCELIGAGGMGEVYRAYDPRLDRQVAIKTLKQNSLLYTEHQDRFDREMRMVASLTHPHIVTLYDVADHGDFKLAVMEFVSGKTLAELIKRDINEASALKHAREIALGLAATHDRNLMHRDIKPENIIITTDGHAKILDFGLARPEVTEFD